MDGLGYLVSSIVSSFSSWAWYEMSMFTRDRAAGMSQKKL